MMISPTWSCREKLVLAPVTVVLPAEAVRSPCIFSAGSLKADLFNRIRVWSVTALPFPIPLVSTPVLAIEIVATVLEVTAVTIPKLVAEAPILTTSPILNSSSNNVLVPTIPAPVSLFETVPVSAIVGLLSSLTVPSFSLTTVFALSATHMETFNEFPSVPGYFAVKVVPEVVVDSYVFWYSLLFRINIAEPPDTAFLAVVVLAALTTLSLFE